MCGAALMRLIRGPVSYRLATRLSPVTGSREKNGSLRFSSPAEESNENHSGMCAGNWMSRLESSTSGNLRIVTESAS